MIEVVCWYILIIVLGFIALPVSFVVFGRLPDRGYSFSKPLGLLLAGLTAWWLGNLQIIGFQWYTCWLAVGLLELVSLGLLWGKPGLRQEMREWFTKKRNLWLVLGSELVFLAGFAFMINVRSFMPALNQSEKFFDLAFIQAIATSPTLPAPDPWYSGQPMNYYYGGQYLMAFLVKLSGVPAPIAYNIAMGLVYGLGAQAAYGLAGNLVGLLRKTVSVSIKGSFLGAALLMILGNLAPLRQLVQHGFLPLSNPSFPFHLDWWATARMIYDPMPPDGKLMDILTEYPIYSYLNGDLHAHLLDAPFVLLALAFLVNCLVSPTQWVLARPHWTSLPRYLAGGIVLGAMAFINGGDFLTYLLLAGVVLLLAESRQAGTLLGILGRWLVQVIGLGCLILLAYYYYFSLFNGMVRAIPDATYGNTFIIGFLSKYLGWVAWPRTYLSEFVVMYGIFLLPILTFLGLELAQVWRQTGQYNQRALPGWAWVLKWPVGVALVIYGLTQLPRAFDDYAAKNLSFGSCIVPVVVFSLAAWLLWPGAFAQLWRRPRLALEGLVFGLLLIIGPRVNFELLGPGVFLLYMSLRLLVRKLLQRSYRTDLGALLDVFALACLAFAAALTLFCELFFIKDIYTNRFNTMMKFWYQMWVLYGVSATYFTVRVIRWRWPALSLVKERLNFTIGWPRLAFPGRVFRLGLPAPAQLFNLKAARVRVSEGPDFGPGWNFNQTSVAPVPGVQTGSEPASPAPVVSSVETGEAAPEGKRWKLRRVFTVLMVFLMLAGTLFPTLAYYQATNHYTNRVDLNGESWYADAFPAEYPAMVFLRNYTANRPDRRGIVLEANGMNYSWGDRVSTYTGLPTIVGWPFHELQWRGNIPELEIWENWLDMDRIYQATDPAKALALLKKHNVRYVFVGQAENGSRSLFSDFREYKKFPPEGLTKFSQFMKTIYSDPDHDIYIYAFY
ncbi:MAG: hypothetical protein J0I20_35830 [Chloroflexi bacterium]|nr:hypothetical protein [Chloroflexota bacterium]OJW06034.1 MAG: hypothetical protein BGO39_04940 [Chloroflexi bacterium 54-19]